MIKKGKLIFACYGSHNLLKDLKHGKISGGKLFAMHTLIFVCVEGSGDQLLVLLRVLEIPCRKSFIPTKINVFKRNISTMQYKNTNK